MDNNSWWHNLDIWRDSYLYDTVDRPTECEALDNIYGEVLRLTPKQKRQLTDWLAHEGADFCRAILRDMRRDAALRELLAARGVTLEFVNVGTPRHEKLLAVEVTVGT